MQRKIIPLLLAVCFFFVFIIPSGWPEKQELIQRIPSEKKWANVNETLVDNLVEKIDRNHPEIILVGDSMLGEAVEGDVLSDYLGMSSIKVWMGGIGSAWIYLFIKNILPQCSQRPQYIGIFFRDNHLTLPQHKTTGKHKESIDNLAGREEPLLDELAYFKDMSFIELLLLRYVPIVNKSENIRKNVDKFIKKFVALLFFQADATALANTLNQTFSDAKMDKGLLHSRQMTDENLADSYLDDMTFNPAKSFLPPIIENSEKLGVKIFFVRVKRKRDLETGQQSDDLIAYMEKLKAYLGKKNIVLIDYTDHKGILEEHYAQGDHLNREAGRSLFTSILAKDIQESILVAHPQQSH